MRRSLLTILIVACAVSLMTSGRITLRLVAPSMLYWSFVPLLQIASLAIVCGRGLPEMSFGRAIDLFLRNNWPPLLWLLLFAAAWCCLPPAAVIPWWSKRWLEFTTAGAALAWSARLDYSFFRYALKRPPRQAVVELLSQRLLCWIPIIVIFVGPAGWQVVASELGL